MRAMATDVPNHRRPSSHWRWLAFFLHAESVMCIADKNKSHTEEAPKLDGIPWKLTLVLTENSLVYRWTHTFQSARPFCQRPPDYLIAE